MLEVPCWEFDDCLEVLRVEFGRADLVDDLKPSDSFVNGRGKRMEFPQCLCWASR